MARPSVSRAHDRRLSWGCESDREEPSGSVPLLPSFRPTATEETHPAGSLPFHRLLLLPSPPLPGVPEFEAARMARPDESWARGTSPGDDASTSHAAHPEGASPDLLRNTPSNIARLEDAIEHCAARRKYLARTKSPSDGEDVRWYFCKLPLTDRGAPFSLPPLRLLTPNAAVSLSCTSRANQSYASYSSSVPGWLIP